MNVNLSTLDVAKLIRMGSLVLFGLAAQLVVGFSINHFTASLAGKEKISPNRRQRIDTLDSVLRNVSTVIIWLFVIMTILPDLGVNIAPLIASAGVVGLAVGFASQTLVKDYISGFFILLENQFNVGDQVTIAGNSGIIEEIKLRYTILRDSTGNQTLIPNSKIDIVTRGKSQPPAPQEA